MLKLPKREYIDLRKKLNNSKEAMIKVFATYTVGFFKNPETYVLQAVNNDVYYCLLNSQNYESNKRRHELERHLDRFFKQEDINKLASNNNIENEVLREIEEKKEYENFLNKTLSGKQNERFYKNKFQDIPLVVIALEEGSTPDAVRDSVNKAKKQIKKKFKKFIKTASVFNEKWDCI